MPHKGRKHQGSVRVVCLSIHPSVPRLHLSCENVAESLNLANMFPWQV